MQVSSLKYEETLSNLYPPIFVGFGVVMAILGGTVKYLNDYEKFAFRKYLITVITSLFTSTITMVLLREFTDMSAMIIAVICGLFGWGGTSVLEFMLDAIKGQMLRAIQTTDVTKKKKNNDEIEGSE